MIFILFLKFILILTYQKHLKILILNKKIILNSNKEINKLQTPRRKIRIAQLDNGNFGRRLVRLTKNSIQSP